MCRLRDLKIDNRRIVVAPGNEPIDTVRWRKESDEMCIYKTGAFTVGQCDSSPLSLAPRSKFPHYLHDVMRHMGTSSEALTCTETVTTPTLLVTRYEYANIYHTMTDWYNVYQTIQINGLQEVNIVFLDGHSAGALDEAWAKLFRTTPKYVSTLTPETCFKEAYLVAPGYGSTLSHATMQRWVKCPPSLYLKDFTRHFLASLGLRHMLGDARSARKRPRVLFLLRKSYLAHPRIRQTPRTLANAKDLVEALRRGLPDVDVEPTSFENMPFAEQVATVRDADVLLSVHGAGLTHLLFMRPGTLVVELIPSGYESNHHYDSFSAFVGVRHIRVSIPRDTPNHGITVDAQQIVNVLRREELRPV
ncbi:EGF domain-specific O-linked N-acetylglucosamine transferase [Hondaea fermentalgiana]|uniref:EGF domain-specific O-linked N-acetylglucosamine transferase n=1 Tax=Hondaea fermentalgiana TaxID=2315210 RepID=A0A2R5GAN6_9STRA|nr:EGF domain-specific O-linked N-acetylglucosamine transferase [Hondaea fermentalgiana]|eukprot:GBG28070.1 EGF domain-specific O-linked N-acetylglucosamine transferase [Hondaea fermentalgiana]